MLRLSLLLREENTHREFCQGLGRSGLAYAALTYADDIKEVLDYEHPDALLVEVDRDLPAPATLELISAVKQQRKIPVIAMIPAALLEATGDEPAYDDFITSPYDARELLRRLNRVLRSSKNIASEELMVCDGLTINLATCEVTVDGKPVELTFKEYELLKLMAGARGRVFTREALLDKIWGYDYYGGDRTVDVHVRRLRSKIENPANTFIETVRNIGYRFKS